MPIPVSAPQACTMCADDVAPRPTGYVTHFDWEDDEVIVPLCMRCGGLGIVFDDEEFHRLVREIARLRFVVCPQSQLPDPSPRLQIIALEEMGSRVADLFKSFGRGVPEAEGSPAAIIAADGVPTLGRLRADHADLLQGFRNDFRKSSDPAEKTCALAMFLAHSGREAKAEQRLLESLDRFPTSVIAYRYVAEFFIVIRRDARRAVRYIRECIRLAPRNAEYRVILSAYLDMLGDEEGAHIAMASARECPDYCPTDCPGGNECAHRREDDIKYPN
jgi:hypothetical protein